MQGRAGIMLHNEFQFQLVGADGKVKQEGKAQNVVLNRYYNALPDQLWVFFEMICLGTGTGTPSASDTDLFNRIAAKCYETITKVTPLGSHQYTWSITTTFTENEANGNLTEVGLGDERNDYVHDLYTHAMITDSEGHTIVIAKTNTDRLTVTATLYLTLTFDNNVDWVDLNIDFEAYPSRRCARSKPERTIDIRYCAAPIRAATGITNNDTTFYMLLARGATKGWRVDCNYTYDSTNKTKRYLSSRINSTDNNMNATYQIFGIGTSYFAKFFPDHNVFPPITLELEQVAAAGNNGDFNFGIPILMDEVTVYVDGVDQSSSAYTWGGKDFRLRQAWASQHGDYIVDASRLVQDGSYDAGTPVCGVQQFQSTREDKSKPYYCYWDFGTPKAVNTFKNSQYNDDSSCTLYYSDDNENWTQAATTYGAGSGTFTRTFETITARYWKIEVSNKLTNYNWEEMQSTFLGAFDFVQPQLHLNTPPAEGAVVKVIAKSEYPIKNSNWIIDQMLVDWKISGGQT
jgi:hypothetical protein